MEQQIKIKPTPKSKPGHLKRLKVRMAISQRLNNNDPKAVDEMIEFVLKNAVVEAPDGMSTEQIKDAIMDMSQEDYEALFPSGDVDPTKDA